MKISVPISYKYCPMPLFLYGTYKEDNMPNFGLFGWFSFYWDIETGVMACVGNNKLTKDRIEANKVFSANLVTEELLPIADYFGNKEGYLKDKMNVNPVHNVCQKYFSWNGNEICDWGKAMKDRY